MDIVYQAPYLNGLYNIVSILLGLAALVFAIHAFQVKGCLICCTAGLGCCGISLLCQLLELNRLAGIGDWAAIEDTIGARVLAAGVLLVLSLGIQTAALLRGRKQGCENC